ncbi:unnamed protein product [Orchesella dallaii]|uniref:O-acyltransferase WSD1 C-terminal domain-containing protein n=1 Tax=Orchesella dallaii TaxID=48710 RepID=A0ABP1QIB8_9HEXA
MNRLRSILWVPVRSIILVIISPLVTVGYWAVVLFIGLPSQLIRKLVSFFAHQLDGDLEKLVTNKGVLIGRDFSEWDTKPSHSIVVVLKAKGKCDPELLKHHVLRTNVRKWDVKKERLEYPELQQYCTLRLGYLFFKWDRKFDISNHVKLYKSREIHEGTVVTDERVQEIWEKVTRRAYKPKTSPWEILIIQNYDPNGKIKNIEELEKLPEDERHSVFILRMHHSLFDGFSIYRLLLSLTDQGLSLWEKETTRAVSKHFKLFLNAKALLCGPTSLTKVGLHGLDFYHGLHHGHGRLTGKYSIATSVLDINVIKNASKLHKVSFHAILIGAISGGMRKYLLKNGLSIPLQPIRLGMPIPQPNHTKKLRNEWLPAMIHLPVEKKTAKQRAVAVNERLDKLKTGSLLPFLTQAMTLIGGFPVEVVRLLSKKSGVTILYSEMRGPNDITMTAFNKKLVLKEVMYSYGLGTDDLGVGFSSASYDGKITLILTLDRGIFNTKEKADDFMQCIVSDIEELQFGDSTKL